MTAAQETTPKDLALRYQIAHYKRSIAKHETELLRDLVFYQKKLADLEKLPCSDTMNGLATIFQTHIKHINNLLSTLRNPQQAC